MPIWVSMERKCAAFCERTTKLFKILIKRWKKQQKHDKEDKHFRRRQSKPKTRLFYFCCSYRNTSQHYSLLPISMKQGFCWHQMVCKVFADMVCKVFAARIANHVKFLSINKPADESLWSKNELQICSHSEISLVDFWIEISVHK